jgi:hypothetical protein
VLSYYEDYWMLMKEYEESRDRETRVSNYLTKEEAQMLQKTRGWRENTLIAYLLVNCVLPLFALSLTSFVSPYVYTIVPVYET